MKLRRLTINLLPGIDQAFEIKTAGTGFHVIFGPNGIGKSSICRAIESVYWDDRCQARQTWVSAEFDIDGEIWLGTREGTPVQWQRGGEISSIPPDLPPSRNYRCFFLRLRDLLDPSPDSTQDIASEIRRQISGGFDLDKIISDLFPDISIRSNRNFRNNFNTALTALQKATGVQSNLQNRVDQLQSLSEQLHKAENSERRLVSVDRALGLAERRDKHAEVLKNMDALPQSLAKLTGEEARQIEALQDQLGEFNKRIRVLEEQIKKAKDTQIDCRLTAPLEQSELSIWRANVEELNRVELELKAARTDFNTHKKELATALSAIGGGDIDEVALALPDHARLFGFLRECEAHKARTTAIRERLRLLEPISESKNSQQNPETYRDAARALRLWLRVPETETISDRIRGRLSRICIAFAMVLAGIGLGVFINPLFILITGVGLGLASSVLLPGNHQSSSSSRKDAQRSLNKIGMEGPREWDVASVESLLHDLDIKIAEIDATLNLVRERYMERNTLENELEGLIEEENALKTRRTELRDSLKFNDVLPDAELVDYARALDELRIARIKREGAAGKVDHLEKRYTELVKGLADNLERQGEPKPVDATTATTYLNGLADRNSRKKQALSDERSAARQCEEVIVDRDSIDKSIRQVYIDTELDNGDMHGLKTLLDLLPTYLELKRDRISLEGQISLDSKELTKAGEVELVECDKPTMEQLRDELSLSANNATDLRNKIAEINAEVNEARQGNNIQDLIAVREEARAKLRERLDDALSAKAGSFLINSVKEKYEQTHTPHVFERARDHFSSFTHNSYELHLSREAGAPRLFAVDLSSGQRRELDELSDGTRAQLLLASRIAFAEEIEQGNNLPLFLDEALDQSDPERFVAIVRGLGLIAGNQERQVFYLTSDPHDVERIRLALREENCDITAEIDLALIRRETASVRGPELLRVNQRPTIPVPENVSAEDYGAMLNVPEFRPVDGCPRQHFFYILSDDLNLLHKFLSNGITWAGQWKTIDNTPLSNKLVTGPISSQQVTFRLDLLDVFCELWKQGRGRPADRVTLEDSEAFSDIFLNNVAEIAQELNGDSERLLQELKNRQDPRLKRLRGSSVEAFEHYLSENGYVDDRPVLTEDELRLQALASPAANELLEGIAGDCLHRWWSWATGVSEQSTLKKPAHVV